MKTAARLLVLAFVVPVSVEAELCPFSGIFYIVRGESGAPLGEAELTEIHGQSIPPTGESIRMVVNVLHVADDGAYRHESDVNPPNMSVLSFFDGNDCLMRLDEATLVYRQRAMRLIFDVTTTWDSQMPLVMVVDSLPFQEGTFELDVQRWLANYGGSDYSKDGFAFIPAEFWRPAEVVSRFTSTWTKRLRQEGRLLSA